MRWNLPSQTAQFVALFRAMGNVAPKIPGYQDQIAEKLIPAIWKPSMAICRLKMKAFPFMSPYPHWLQLVGVMLQFRTVVLDTALKNQLPFDQLVILGAGLDSRAWRMKELSSVKVFEVDHPATQGWKRQQVKKIEGEQKAAEVKFVSVDFRKDDLKQKLEESGFEKEKKTFWIWEGVTMYLEEEDVKKTMRLVSELSTGGGSLALTYLQKINGKLPVSWIISSLGEPFHSAYSPLEISKVAQDSGGWSTIADSGVEQWKESLCPELTIPNRLFGSQFQERIWVGQVLP